MATQLNNSKSVFGLCQQIFEAYYSGASFFVLIGQLSCRTEIGLVIVVQLKTYQNLEKSTQTEESDKTNTPSVDFSRSPEHCASVRTYELAPIFRIRAYS
jgi:hypothetical protein